MRKYTASKIATMQKDAIKAKADILKLAQLQLRLQELCQIAYWTFRDRNGADKKVTKSNFNTLTQFAAQNRISEGTVRSVYKRLSVVYKGQNLIRLCEVIGHPDLATKIIAAAQNLKSGHVSLALFDKETIDTIFTLYDIHLVHFAGYANYGEFAKIFKDNLAKIIEGALKHKKDAVKQIAKQEIREQIEVIITDPAFDKKIQERLDDIKTELQEAASRLRVVVEKIKEHVTMADQIVRALQSTNTTYHQACRGLVPTQRIEELITAGESFLATKSMAVMRAQQTQTKQTADSPVKHMATQAQTPNTDAQEFVMPQMGMKRTRQSKPQKSNGARQPSIAKKSSRRQLRKKSKTIPLDEIGGGVSPTGVTLCLTKRGFAHVDMKPSDTMILEIIKQIRITRALINVCSQIADTAVREETRNKLDMELVELELSIRQFSAQFPGRLCELFDGTREHMAKILTPK